MSGGVISPNFVKVTVNSIPLTFTILFSYRVIISSFRRILGACGKSAPGFLALLEPYGASESRMSQRFTLSVEAARDFSNIYGMKGLFFKIYIAVINSSLILFITTTFCTTCNNRCSTGTGSQSRNSSVLSRGGVEGRFRIRVSTKCPSCRRRCRMWLVAAPVPYWSQCWHCPTICFLPCWSAARVPERPPPRLHWRRNRSILVQWKW